MLNNEERPNYLTSFRIEITKHIRSTLKFQDTSGLTDAEIKLCVEELLARAVPIAPETFNWLRTILRYVQDRGQWLVYDNSEGLWHYEYNDDKLRSIMNDYFQVLYDEAANHNDRVYQWYAKSFFQSQRINGLLTKLKGGIQFVEPSADRLLENNFNIRYFDTINGERCLIDLSKDVFNMRTVKFAETQKLMLQHKAPVPIADTDEEPKLWLELIDTYMLHDPVKVEFFKRVLAYMMMPYNYNQVLLYWFGAQGRNGKSTVLKVLQDILGPHATRLNSDLINAKPNMGFKKDDALAATEGKSLLIFNEIDERAVASTQNIKDLTEGGRDEFGNKTMTVVRPAYSRNYEINICGTPLIVANTLINLGEWSNLAPIFRRLVLVSFDHHIAKEDPTILNRLAQEYPQIQAWLYMNYFHYKKIWLDTNTSLKSDSQDSNIYPQEWSRAMVNYQDSSDLIKQFWFDCITEQNPRNQIKKPDLYKMYVAYCKANGRIPIRNTGSNSFQEVIRPYIQPLRSHKVNGIEVLEGLGQTEYYKEHIAGNVI